MSEASKQLELRLKLTGDGEIARGNQALAAMSGHLAKVEKGASQAARALGGLAMGGGPAGSAHIGTPVVPGGGPAAGANAGAALLSAITSLNKTMSQSLKFEQEQVVKQQQAANQAKAAKAAKEPGFLRAAAESGVLGGTPETLASLAGGSLGKVGGIAAGGALAYQAMRTGTEWGNITQNPYTTGAQKNRALARSLPFGETIQGFADTIRGRPAAFAREEERSRLEEARTGGELQRMQFQSGQNINQAGLQSRADYYRDPRNGPITESGRIPESVIRAGGGAMTRAQTRLSFDRQEQAAGIESKAATAAREQVEKEQKKLAEKMKAAQEERDRLVRIRDGMPEAAKPGEGQRPSSQLPPAMTVGPWGAVFRNSLDRGAGFAPTPYADSGAEREKVLNQITDQNKLIGGIAAQQQSGAGALRDAQGRETQAKGNEKRVGAARARGEAGIAEQQAASAAGGAQTLGGMDPFERADAAENVRLLLAHGPDALDPSQIASARAIAPQTVGAALEKAGANTPEYQKLKEIAPEDFAGDPGELRKRASDKRSEADKKDFEAQGDAAGGLAQQGREFGKNVAEAIKAALDAALEQIRNEMRQGQGRKD